MSFPLAVAAVAGTMLSVGLGHQAQSTFQTHRPHRGWTQHEVDCESRNTLIAHRREAGPQAPELFFEAGLMNTSTSWLMLADALAQDYTVTVYDRAGYRASRRGQTEPYTIAESVSDAVDVVRTLRRPGSKVWLVGHSIGGYLAHRTAAMSDDIAGLVLLDPMHPQELVTSNQQREGSKSVDLSLRTGPLTIAVGGGLLMDKAGILGAADGNPYVGALSHEVSAFSTWRAALREWKYSYPYMLDGAAPLTDLDVPVHVVAASATVQGSTEQRDLFDAYVASGTAASELRQIEDATHLGIVTSAAVAPAVLSAIRSLTSAPITHSGPHHSNEVTSNAGR